MPLLTSPVRPLSAPLRAALGSAVLQQMAAPHGVSRFLEHLHPLWTLEGGRAQVTAVRELTPRLREIELQPDHAWTGHLAGQHVRLGVVIDGSEVTRTYTVTSSAHRADGRITLAVGRVEDGTVSGHVHDRLRVGDVVACSPATGDVTLPDPRPDDLVLVTGGSGCTPALSWLRTLADEGHAGRVTWVHHAPTLADVPHREELAALAARPGTTITLALTQQDAPAPGALRTLPRRATVDDLAELGVDLTATSALTCGPHELVDAVTAWFADADASDRLATEPFTAAPLTRRTGPTGGEIRYATSATTVASDGRTLLEQAEDAGLEPAFGCRMGICHTCTRRVTAGAVTDLRSGRTADATDREVDLCVSVPDGDVTVDL